MVRFMVLSKYSHQSESVRINFFAVRHSHNITRFIVAIKTATYEHISSSISFTSFYKVLCSLTNLFRDARRRETHELTHTSHSQKPHLKWRKCLRTGKEEQSSIPCPRTD